MNRTSRLAGWIDGVRGSPLGGRLARGAFWSLAGAAISRALALISAFVVARHLGRDAYGGLGVVTSTATLFQSFALFGLGVTATKFVSAYRRTDPLRAGRIMALSSAVAACTGTVFALGVLLLAPFLARHVLAAPELAPLLRVSAPMMVFGALNGAQMGALAGLEAFPAIAKVNLYSGVGTFPVTVGGAVLGGLEGAVWGMSLAQVLTWGVSHLELRREAARAGIPLRPPSIRSEWPVLWSFSLPAVLAGVLTAIGNWGASAILVNQPGGYSEMGVFSAALRVKQVPEMVLGLVMMPLLPVLSDLFARQDLQRYAKVLGAAYSLSFLVVVPVSLLCTSVPALAMAPFGQVFSGNAPLMQWFMLQSIAVGVLSPISNVVASSGRMWFGFTYNLAWGCLYLGLAWVLVPRLGGTGLAAAFALAYLASTAGGIAYIHVRDKSLVGGAGVARMGAIGLGLYGLAVWSGLALGDVAAAACGVGLAAVALGLGLMHLRRHSGIGSAPAAAKAEP